MNQRKRAKRAKPWEFESHWPKLIEGLNVSSQEFYISVEAALAGRKIPDVQTTRVMWKEGGPFSPGREYLRATRQRLIFDICGAPFGTGFFVSLWCGQKPLQLGLLAILGFVALLLAFFEFFFGRATGLSVFLWHTFGINVLNGTLLFLGLALGTMVVVLIRVGLDLDDFLINTPVVGYVYERYFRRITLYRIDQTCMYQAAVHAAVVQVIDEMTKAKGIKPLSELERRPVFRGLAGRQPAHARA